MRRLFEVTTTLSVFAASPEEAVTAFIDLVKNGPMEGLPMTVAVDGTTVAISDGALDEPPVTTPARGRHLRLCTPPAATEAT